MHAGGHRFDSDILHDTQTRVFAFFMPEFVMRVKEDGESHHPFTGDRRRRHSYFDLLGNGTVEDILGIKQKIQYAS